MNEGAIQIDTLLYFTFALYILSDSFAAVAFFLILLLLTTVLIYLLAYLLNITSCTYACSRPGRSRTILEHSDHSVDQSRSVYTRTVRRLVHRLDCRSQSDRTHNLSPQLYAITTIYDHYYPSIISCCHGYHQCLEIDAMRLYKA